MSNLLEVSQSVKSSSQPWNRPLEEDAMPHKVSDFSAWIESQAGYYRALGTEESYWLAERIDQLAHDVLSTGAESAHDYLSWEQAIQLCHLSEASYALDRLETVARYLVLTGQWVSATAINQAIADLRPLVRS